MTRRITCDQCNAVVEPDGLYELSYPAVDEDGDELFAESHFCSVACVSSWAMAYALDGDR